MSHSISVIGRRFCLSASALAIMAAGASAQTTVLTPSSANYDLVAQSGVDKAVEISSGTNAYFSLANSGTPLATIPAGAVAILSNTGWPNGIGSSGGWDLSWWEVTTNAPVIKVDNGASLTFTNAGGDYNFESMIQASGDVTFQAAEWRIWKSNSFLGNVTILDGAIMDFGSKEWGCCTFAGTVTFGPNTNIDMNGSTINLYQTGTDAVVGGRISGSSAAVINVYSQALIVNGNYGSTGKSFNGVVNVSPDATFTVGDSSHPSAVFGDPAGNSATINIQGTTSTLSGYGTIYGNVNSVGGIKAGGNKTVMGNLTVDGSLNLADSSQLYTAVSPTGASGLIVNGNAKLAGDLIINITDGTYGNNVFPLVAVSNGTITGSFATISTSGNVAGAMVGLMKSVSGYNVVTEKGSAAQVFGHLPYANRTALTSFVGSIYDVMAITPQSGAKFDTWLTPIGEIENVERDGLGYENTTYGLSAGAMHRFERHGGVLGAALSYRHGSMSVKDDPATASTDAFDFAVYGGADVNVVRFEGSAFYNVYEADTKRPMGAYGTAVADGQRGFAYGVSGQISRDMFSSLVAPYVRAMYARNHLGSASEAGSDFYDLRHDAIDINSFSVDLGIRVHLLRPEPDRRFKVDADVAWRHDLSDPGETVVGGFVSTPDSSSVAYWKGDSQNALRAGLNVAGRITDQLEVYSRLDGVLTSYRRAGELAAGVKYRF